MDSRFIKNLIGVIIMILITIIGIWLILPGVGGQNRERPGLSVSRESDHRYGGSRESGRSKSRDRGARAQLRYEFRPAEFCPPTRLRPTPQSTEKRSCLRS
jgi:hypothetical protein